MNERSSNYREKGGAHFCITRPLLHKTQSCVGDRAFFNAMVDLGIAR